MISYFSYPLSPFQCSSASRKFLNRIWNRDNAAPEKFQCSSASRKFLNRMLTEAALVKRQSFSALQRAENSSIQPAFGAPAHAQTFQCSSASRKFLNRSARSVVYAPDRRFSALQRAENSSIVDRKGRLDTYTHSFSALQRAENSSIQQYTTPKRGCQGFSALQRAENSSIVESQ